MWRGIMVTLIVTCLLACGAAVWIARDAVIAPFVLPGATDLVVTQGVNSISIEYRADGNPYQWHDRLWKRLTETGRNGRSYAFTGTRSPFVLVWYTHEMGFGPFALVEHAIVGGGPEDPNLVTVRIHHELQLRGSARSP